MRNLTKTLAVVSLLIPASAYPLGIGEIKLHSALNQNLDAEIALVLSPGEKVSDIKVNLAPPDKFDESGILWTYFLSKIKFQASQTANGSVVVKVTSNEALKEPFLDFLLEVSWPKGRLYREFTVLVDPPATYEQSAVPVATQAESYGYEREFMPQRQMSARTQARRVKSAAISGEQYGPTVKNDTLWSVAQRISKPADVSIEQMMLALYEANPDAFYKQNVNALLAGKTLKIPSKEVILKFSRQQALDEFNRQTQSWRNRSVEPIAATVASGAGTTENQLTLVAPKQETVGETAVVDQRNEQGEAGQKTAGVSPVPTMSETAGANDKSAATVASSDDAVQAKVAALEKQLAVMQELIALKDQQLATLQQQAQTKPGAEQHAAPEQQAITSQQPPVSEQQPAPVAPAAPSEAVVGKPAVQEAPVQPQPAKPAPAPAAKRVAPPAVSATPKTDDTAYWYYLGGGSAGLGLLAYGWFLWRKRKLENSFDSDNKFAFAGSSKSSIPADVFSGSVLEDSNSFDSDFSGTDNLFSTDFAASDFDMFDMDQGEIDPISEADVYLAYGRYQQAEELMRHAIKDQPQRDECKLKLLEIFYASENRTAFEEYANELAEAGKQDDSSFWAKVIEMGGEICPDSILFATQIHQPDLTKHATSESIEVMPTRDDDKQTDQLPGDMDFDLASFDELFSDKTSSEATAEQNSLFDLNEATTFSDQKQDIDFIDEPQPNNASIDFDLSAFSVTTEKPVEDYKDLNTPEIAKSEGFEAFDFNADLTDTPVKDSEESEHYLDFSVNKVADFRETVAQTSLDDDFDFNTAIAGANTALAGKESSFGVSDLTEMDAMETKLDLAIAYIDMGDNEAAKEIALEVAEKGTAEQRTLAQSLLDSL